MKNAWPVKAQALGGRHKRTARTANHTLTRISTLIRSNTRSRMARKMYMDGRCINGCNAIYSSYAHGSKGIAIVSKNGDCAAAFEHVQGPESATLKNDLDSKAIPGQEDPYQNEWNDLIDAIRNDKPYNEVKRGVEASLVTQHGPHGGAHRPGNQFR